MGANLFDEVREFREAEPQIDYILGYSVRELCLRDTAARLRDTQYTQPALFIVNALHHYKALSEGARPQLLAGHSLGEYNALLAAGCFDLLTGIQLVQKRGELMSKRPAAGGMLAVVGLSVQRVEGLLRENGLTGVDVANYNSPTQTVISGLPRDLERAQTIYDRAGAQMVVPLPVSAAFHSRYMAEAATAFEEFLAPIKLSPPRLPVIANVTASEYPSQESAVKALLVRQITSSVRWTESVRTAIDEGIEHFREVGPGNVLTRLIEAIRRASPRENECV
jgi:malonyl CoA-acyl carrier protein transacylase